MSKVIDINALAAKERRDKDEELAKLRNAQQEVVLHNGIQRFKQRVIATAFGYYHAHFEAMGLDQYGNPINKEEEKITTEPSKEGIADDLED